MEVRARAREASLPVNTVRIVCQHRVVSYAKEEGRDVDTVI